MTDALKIRIDLTRARDGYDPFAFRKELQEDQGPLWNPRVGALNGPISKRPWPQIIRCT
jgi:hypothetical protein